MKKVFRNKKVQLFHSDVVRKKLRQFNEHESFPSPTKRANFITRNHRDKILKLLSNVSESELIIINSMLGKMDRPEQVMHFFLGAHIELYGDNGATYSEWKDTFKNKYGSIKNRISSHKSEDQQHSVSGHVLSEALFGTRYVDKYSERDKKYTWIQLESHPVGGMKEWTEGPKAFVKQLKYLFLHMFAYFDYKWNDVNIGPYGKSSFTEKKPLKIDVSGLTPEMEAANRALWIETFFSEPGVVTDNLVERIDKLNKNELSYNKS